MTKEDPNFWYLYVITDPRYFGPFKYGDLHLETLPVYIGISFKEIRFKDHLRSFYGDNKHNKKAKSIYMQKMTNESGLKPLFQKILVNIPKKDICSLEIKYISLIGREDKNQGTLLNLTSGGEGCFQMEVSDKTKKVLSEKAKARMTPEFRKKLCEIMTKANAHRIGVKRPEHSEMMKKISGPAHRTPEYHEKTSGQKNVNNKYFWMLYKDGFFLYEGYCASDMCKLFGLNIPKVYQVVNTNVRHHGYTIFRESYRDGLIIGDLYIKYRYIITDLNTNEIIYDGNRLKELESLVDDINSTIIERSFRDNKSKYKHYKISREKLD